MRDYAKARSKELKLAGKGGVRINSAGCLDRCSEGPVLVIYPQEVWYNYVDQKDIDEIIEEHLVNDRVVERLVIWALKKEIFVIFANFNKTIKNQQVK